MLWSTTTHLQRPLQIQFSRLDKIQSLMTKYIQNLTMLLYPMTIKIWNVLDNVSTLPPKHS